MENIVKNIVKKIIEKHDKPLTDMERTLMFSAVQTLLNNTCEGAKGGWKGKRMIIPSPASYLGAWAWDSAFHALGVAKWDLQLGLEQIELFFDEQEESGLFPDTLFLSGEKCTCISKPPVFAWVTKEIYQNNTSINLPYYYEKLVKNAQFWEKNRKTGELFHYDAEPEEDEAEYIKHCRNESGWDNSVRWDNGAQNLWAIDLNCYMVLTYRALAYFANELNKEEEYCSWKEKADTLSRTINKVMWNEARGCYFDVDTRTKQCTNVYTPASFMPLFAEIADDYQAECLAKLALDDNKFYPLFPTVSYDNKEYNSTDFWRGPCWLNVAYFALKGLANYGYFDVVKGYKERLLTTCYENTQGIFEYYDTRTGKGIGAIGFSWSAVFIIEMILDL